MKLFLMSLLVISNPLYVLAATQSVEMTEKVKRDNADKVKQNNTENVSTDSEFYSKFAQWGDNEILFRYTDTKGTGRHADVSLGFRYLMTDTPIPKGDKSEDAWAIAYQGEFDFFALTRNSSPVVTTRHNPSIFYTRMWDPDKLGLSSWFISLEHESNGQVTDTQARLDAEINGFRTDYENDNDVSEVDIFEMAQQTISRSNNFFGVGVNYQIDGVQDSKSFFYFLKRIHIFAKFRYQLDKEPEDSIWWQLEQSAQLKDYVGTELDLSSSFDIGDMKSSVRLTYRTGQLLDANPFKKHTFDLRYYIDVPVGRVVSRVFDWKRAELFAIPLVFRYHHGYLDELYNYSQEISYLAIGLHARY